MSKLLKLFVIVSLSLLFFANCDKKRGDDKNTIKLESTVNKTLTLGKVSEIIQLETSEESLLDFITKTYIDKQNNRIFVNSRMNIFLFDLKGKFITKLIKGKGPGEVNMVVSFTVDAKNKRFYVLDFGSIIHIYDYNANHIETQNLTEFYSLDLHPIDKENLFLYCSYVGRKEKYFVGIYNLKEKKIVERFIPSDESPYSILCAGNASNFYEFQNRLFFSSSNIFGLYEFQSDTFRRTINFDIGVRAVPESFYGKYVEKRKRSGFGSDALKKGYVPYLRESFFFNGYYLTVLYDESSSCYAINATNRNRVYFKEQLSDYFNLPRVNSLYRACAVQDDFMTFACSPLDFFEENSTEKGKSVQIAGQKINVDYDSNPFLIVVK